MSLRILYRKIPASKRICSYYRCEKPILRNIDMDEEGTIYHHGCLLSAREERYRCLNCGGIFDGTRLTFDQAFGKLVRACPECGSYNLKDLRRKGVTVTFPHARIGGY